uniref:Uncharacterized protein n=1 Tax=Streptomyces sp. NBC_01393 TaxID=2903851 RepID=A0AAU3HN98_9ACTN
MSGFCNTHLSLSSEALRDKKRLALDAGIELLAATSDMFKALELSEHGDSTASTAVYVASAEKRLRHSGELLADVSSLLESASLTPEMTEWYKQLDYARLYSTGLDHGYIPRSQDIWNDVAELAATGGPQAMCRSYRGQVLEAADRMTKWLETAKDPESAAELLQIQSTMIELVTCGQLQSYFNGVEPGDNKWLQYSAA